MSPKKNTGKGEDAVIEKLDKVADTLESASSQLSNAVTQQQLDLARDRIVALEGDVEKIKENYKILVSRSTARAHHASETSQSLKTMYESLERDFAGLRALVLSSFALATVSLMGLVVYAVVS